MYLCEIRRSQDFHFRASVSFLRANSHPALSWSQQPPPVVKGGANVCFVWHVAILQCFFFSSHSSCFVSKGSAIYDVLTGDSRSASVTNSRAPDRFCSAVWDFCSPTSPGWPWRLQDSTLLLAELTLDHRSSLICAFPKLTDLYLYVFAVQTVQTGTVFVVPNRVRTFQQSCQIKPFYFLLFQ